MARQGFESNRPPCTLDAYSRLEQHSFLRVVTVHDSTHHVSQRQEQVYESSEARTHDTSLMLILEIPLSLGIMHATPEQEAHLAYGSFHKQGALKMVSLVLGNPHIFTVLDLHFHQDGQPLRDGDRLGCSTVVLENRKFFAEHFRVIGGGRGRTGNGRACVISNLITHFGANSCSGHIPFVQAVDVSFQLTLLGS